MVFIRKTLQVGDKVRITHDVELTAGTFTRGHEFTIESDAGHRGWNLVDKDGNRLSDAGPPFVTLERV